MITSKKQKTTIMLDKEVYDGLLLVAGKRGLGAYVSALARPFVVTDDLEKAYEKMAADEVRNREIEVWDESELTPPLPEEPENAWKF